MRSVLGTLILVVCGCAPTVTFPCRGNDDCRFGSTAGRCEPSGACSFPDESCEGWRYGERSPPQLANRCVSCAVEVGAGDEHTCARLANGEVACWGAGGSPVPQQVPEIAGARDLSVGAVHQCVVLEDGSAWCWGGNLDGQLGDGTTTSSQAPVRVADLSGVDVIAAGGSMSCALRAGEAWCWGDALHGQVGDGGTTDRPRPVRAGTRSDYVQLSAGYMHVCAVRNEGRVDCWGWNDDGQLGDGTTDTRTAPGSVDGLTDVVRVSAGFRHTCARSFDGAVRCWGRGLEGELGDGSLIGRPQPAPALIDDTTDITAAGFYCFVDCPELGPFTCAIADGAVQCWGSNVNGQVSSDTATSLSSPTLVTLPAPAAMVSGGAAHVCATTATGEVYCWGKGLRGELGTGASPDRAAPERAVLACP